MNPRMALPSRAALGNRNLLGMGTDVAEDEQHPAPQANPEAVTVLMLPGVVDQR